MARFILSELAERLGAQLIGDADCQITSTATLENAQSGQISFLSNSKYRKFLSETAAPCKAFQSPSPDSSVIPP